jgi:hypothetical protein
MPALVLVLRSVKVRLFLFECLQEPPLCRGAHTNPMICFAVVGAVSLDDEEIGELTGEDVEQLEVAFCAFLLDMMRFVSWDRVSQGAVEQLRAENAEDAGDSWKMRWAVTLSWDEVGYSLLLFCLLVAQSATFPAPALVAVLMIWRSRAHASAMHRS